MKKIKGIERFVVTATTLLSVLWQAGVGQCCISGRYGRYDNWPSTNDWEELLILLTGKYGKHGWGWQQHNSYAYNSIGDYPFGTLKYSSTPWGTSGSSGSGGSSSGLYSASHSTSSNSLSGNSYSTGSDDGSKSATDKIKEALNSYFKSKPATSSHDSGSGGWGSGGSGGAGAGGGFVGESFVDSPRPGPPYDDSPPGPGPPYPPSPDDNSGLGSPPLIPQFHRETASWPGGESGNGPFNSAPPHGGGGDHQSSWPLPQGTPITGSFQDPQQPLSHNNNFLNNEGGVSGNQFQSDFDTFSKKRRRQGRRRSHSLQPQQLPQHSPQTQPQTRPHRQRQAGLRARPISGVAGKKPPFKFPPYPGGRRPSRQQRRLGLPMSLRRRKLDTSFGGYKVDHSRIRFG